MKLFSRLVTLTIVILISLAIVSGLISNADPAVRAERTHREQIKTQHAAQRAEIVTTLVQGVVIIGLAAMASAVVFGLGIGSVVVLDRLRRAREIRPDRGTALYPIIREAHGAYANLNTPQAQQLATLAAARRRPTAAMVGRVLDAPRTADTPQQIAAPADHYPARVEIYNSPLPRQLALPVGVAGDGQPVTLPLRGLGNVVIGGLPNSGKSELLASITTGLWRQDAAGQQQQLAIVDMKLVSFGNLPPGLDGLRWPVATDIDQAHRIIAAARDECQQRYETLRSAHVRTLEEYQQHTGQPLPYLTVLVDEIADLTQDDDRSRRDRFLSAAMEIARKGRAAGVSLIMATQRPSVDVLPASLRNLAGAAIAFRVSRNHDSVAILGEPGAEVLPPIPGRCLLRHRSIIQVQAYYAGLEGGRFDHFIQTLPRSSIAASNWPVRPPVPVHEPLYQSQTALHTAIPPFSTDNRSTYTPQQITHINARYAALGSIKAVQRELYDQDGGYWFYRIKDVLT